MISFAGGSSTAEGILITLLAVLTLALVAVVGWGIGRRMHHGRHVELGEYAENTYQWPSPPLRKAPGFCLNFGIILLALCPVASLTGRSGALLPLGCVALLAFGVSAILISVSRATPDAAAADPLGSLEDEHVADVLVR